MSSGPRGSVSFPASAIVSNFWYLILDCIDNCAACDDAITCRSAVDDHIVNTNDADATTPDIEHVCIGESFLLKKTLWHIRVRSHQAKANAKATSLTYGCCYFLFNYSHKAMPRSKKNSHSRSFSFGVNEALEVFRNEIMSSCHFEISFRKTFIVQCHEVLY